MESLGYSAFFSFTSHVELAEAKVKPADDRIRTSYIVPVAITRGMLEYIGK